MSDEIFNKWVSWVYNINISYYVIAHNMSLKEAREKSINLALYLTNHLEQKKQENLS